MPISLRTCLACLTLAVGLAGCPSHTFLSIPDQEKIQVEHEKKVYFLKQSFFVGPFFVYDDRLFISERAFDERALIESPGGNPILPADPIGILPMGTRVTITDIEFPSGSVIAARKLKSPRHFTWVMLDPEGDQPDKPCVLVLTQEFRKAKDFQNALSVYLVPEDPRIPFATATPEELAAINRKGLTKGMRIDAVFRSRGHPDKVTRNQVEGVKVEEWQYARGRKVILRDDLVDSWEGFPVLDVEVFGTTDPVAPNPKPSTPGADDTRSESPHPDSP